MQPGVVNDASTCTQAALSHTCQIHQATQKFHRNEERQEVTGALWSRWSLAVSEDHCVCLSLSVSAPDFGKEKKCKAQKKKGGGLRGSAFPLNPKKRDYQSHNNMDASQKPCQLSELSYISDRFFPPFFFLIFLFLDGIIPLARLFITEKHIR